MSTKVSKVVKKAEISKQQVKGSWKGRKNGPKAIHKPAHSRFLLLWFVLGAGALTRSLSALNPQGFLSAWRKAQEMQ